MVDAGFGPPFNVLQLGMLLYANDFHNQQHRERYRLAQRDETPFATCTANVCRDQTSYK